MKHCKLFSTKRTSQLYRRGNSGLSNSCHLFFLASTLGRVFDILPILPNANTLPNAELLSNANLFLMHH